MKDTAVLAILLTAFAAGSAHAQNATSRVQQTRATSAQQVQSPAAAPAATAASPAVRAGVAQISPYAAATKQTLPGNLFQMEDRAIIIVGGKPVAAGDVKRQLLADIRQGVGPVAVGRSASRVTLQPVRDNNGPGLPGVGVGTKLKPGSRFGQERITAAGGVAGASVAGSVRDSVARDPALSYADMKNYCKTHPIEISRVRGTVTPNGWFTIQGNCFGDQTGEVVVIGQFPGGSMRLLFDRWSDFEIHAFVPPVTGATDHAISLTVVRSADKAHSAAAQARFVATREIVPVPARYWSPYADFFTIDVDQGGGNIFSGYTVWGTGPGEARIAPFTLQVNPNCWLDSAAWNVRTGRVEAFMGWEDGPPHLANVKVAWTPRCVTQTTNYVVASSSQRICSVDFSLSAWASCPVGVAP